MSTTSDDIQAAGFDTRPPMLDRTDYESWAQCIRLYYKGKENGVYILQSIDEGPFQLGTTRETIGTTEEGGLPKDIYKIINHNIKAKAIWDNVKMLLARVVVQNVQGRQNQNQRNFARGADAVRNRVLDEEELHFFASEQTNTFDVDVDVDVDEQPSIFMANLSSASPVSSQAVPSHASILSEVPDLENNIDHVGEIHDEHEILNEVQQTSVVDSDSVYIGNSNIIPYERYVMNNEGYVVPNNASCVRIDDSLAAELAIYKEHVTIYEQCAKFKLTEREQRMDDQMRMLIQDLEVDQNVIDKKCDEIERKNLLITNKNLIANCLAQDVFYTVTNSALTASRFHDLSVAYNVAKTRVVKLEAENFRLNEKFKKMIMIPCLDPKSIDSHNIQLIDTVNTLQKQIDPFQAENEKIKQDYKELYDSIKITCAKHIKKTTSLHNEIENLKSQVKRKIPIITSENDVPKASTFEKYAIDVEPIPSYNRNNSDTKASVSKPRSNTKNDRTTPAKRMHKKKVEDHLRNNKSNLNKKNRVDSSISSKRTVKQSWQATGKVFSQVGYQWKATGRTFTIGEQCPFNTIIKPKVVPVRQWKPTSRIIPLSRQSPLIRSIASTSALIVVETQAPMVPVPMFDEYFEPPTVDQPIPPAPIAQVLDNPTGPSVSISVDQDAPSTSHLPSSSDPQSSSVHQDVADINSFRLNPFAPTDNDHFVNIFASKPGSKASSSEDVIVAETNKSIKPLELLRK
nr:hypothetical protein [Tanacetum cinerariifolium]